MDSKNLKKILAGLGIASLLAGAAFSITGCTKTGKSA
ncbi:MAG: selenobiotic family radical SAM modification target peptide [Proteobacteria bacterium]|nr:selenobiotic family radical SAM modification target peptide [Pseudomonadota bacterium]MBU1710310.1 selenobiotic family radical SAM modification target peptide [Pseudomonadota bacterium]